MSPKFPITKTRIRNHFQYFWWQYALLLLIAVFGWNLVYTTTRYQSPEHLKIEWYYEGAVSNATDSKAAALLEEARQELFPEMEEMTFAPVGNDETYGDMQLMVWIAAGQGDLYMLSRQKFGNMAANEAMLDLQPYIDDGTLHVEGLDLTEGYVTNTETGERMLCGIPTDSLQGFLNYDVDPAEKVLSVLASGGNTENTIKLLAKFLDMMR